jgi:transmembrane sensor
MKMEKFRKLCIKKLTGNINSDESLMLEKLLDESDENKLEYNRIKSVWERTASYKIPGIPVEEAEWDVLYAKVKDNMFRSESRGSIFDEVFSSVKSLFAPKWKPVFNIATAVILLAAGILLLTRQQPVPNLISMETGNKETRQVLLSDGSVVQLNSGSKIQYLEKFDSKIREIKLTGEAFFSVTKSTAPFVVVTENAKVSVLGTQFDVYARDEKTEVVVKEGKVNLAQKFNNAGVYLTRNQSSSVVKNANPVAPKEVDSEYALGWMTGKLVFDQTPLRNIVDELQRYYDVKISVESKELNSNTLTGSFKNKGIDSTIEMICLAMNLSFEKHGNTFLIRSKK